MHQANPIASALMAKMQIESQERAWVKLECLRMLATLRLELARAQLVGGFMEKYIDNLMTGLPGEDLIRQGLADVQGNRYTIAACLIHIARPRLNRAGLLPPSCAKICSSSLLEPEIQLYRLLQAETGDAYSRYNALVRELVSFEMALDHRLQKQQVQGKRSPQ